jgi:L-arabinose isomerase
MEGFMNPKIGLLGLYLKLYDDKLPDRRNRVDRFYGELSGEMEKKGISVVPYPVCRIKEEFQKAVEHFEKSKVDAIVTIHLAYSPSLESIGALSKTGLPIIVLDTTPTFSYGPEQDPDELMFNHGIHGVQDMCNLLIRNKKDFYIESGHWQKSDVIDRIAGLAKSAMLGSNFKKSKVGIIGNQFAGMGDFFVPFPELKKQFGIEVINFDFNETEKIKSGISKKEIEDEIKNDNEIFNAGKFEPEVHLRTAKTTLLVEKWVKEKGLSAFTFNFSDIVRKTGFETIPFLAASKLMAKQIGYAGEGDVLTSALVGTLFKVFPETSFTEMFCPDWENNAIFLNHMGEFNYKLSAEKAKLIEMNYAFGDNDNPAFAVGCFKEGDIQLVNLAPLGEGKYRLIIASAQMLKVSGKDNMANIIHGWFKTDYPVGDFLRQYSYFGGTHHLALVYSKETKVFEDFGKMMEFDVKVIK